ncbi:MAG: Rpn family recombination-promoting nuclease/putative transposase [Treponema sp.]|nr:Rpn family recombination-promoting nuclease/putative transposase [Treponema sp.]
MKNDTFVSPLEDFAFKQIFGEQQNIDITRAFLKTLLDVPADEYDKLTIVNPNLGKMFRQGKSGIVDIRLTTKSKKIIHIELQVEKRTNMKNRIMYYLTKQISDQLKWGDDFKKLHQVISIVICNHVLLDEEESYINDYELRNKNNNSFTDLQKLIILELPKLPEAEDGALWPWLRFLMCKKKEEYEMLKKKYPELEKPVKYAHKMSLLERWRDERFHRNLAKIDEECLYEQIRLDAREAESKKWQAVVADMKTEIESLRSQLAELSKK